MSKLEIRPITDEDVAATIDLWKRCELTMPHNDPHKDIAFARAGLASDVLGGFYDGKLVASVMVGHDGHRGSLYYVSTDPGVRGMGLGAAIVEAAEDWLRQRGVWKLNVMVRKTNLSAKGFYESIGYGDDPVVTVSKRLDENEGQS